jgi:hypothetical protein
MFVLLCSLCDNLVEIESAKTNEFGKAVHEECYVQKMQATHLRQLRILAWISTVPATAACSACGQLFTEPVKELTTVMTNASLQLQFDDHICKIVRGAA